MNPRKNCEIYMLLRGIFRILCADKSVSNNNLSYTL